MWRKPECFLTRTYALYELARARSLPAASARDTMGISSEKYSNRLGAVLQNHVRR